MRGLKRIGIVATVIIALLVTLPFLIPFDGYIPRIEKEASEKLKEPVSIKNIRLAMLPLPHVHVRGITIGKSTDIQMATVSVTPDLWSLFSATKVIKSIDVDGLTLTQKGIDKIPLWIKSDTKTGASSPAAFRLQRLRLNDALIKLDKADVGPLDANVTLDSTGFPEEATVSTQDGKLNAQIKPDKSGLVVDVRGKSWKLPVSPAIQFDELLIKGTVTQTGANLNQITARLYGGSVSGSIKISWQRGSQLNGQFDVEQIEIQPLLVLLSGKSSMSGRLNATPRINANAASAGQLAAAMRVEGPFNVQNGVLYGVDIQKTATNLLSKETGGQTRFDQLSGYMVVERGAQHISQLQVRSGALAAQGNVNVSSRKELSGRIYAQVKASQIAAAEVPLNVSGTVDSPMLLPTGASIAGAAVGTAILGPGVGTTVGSKIGTWTEGLFGRK